MQEKQPGRPGPCPARAEGWGWRGEASRGLVLFGACGFSISPGPSCGCGGWGWLTSLCGSGTSSTSSGGCIKAAAGPAGARSARPSTHAMYQSSTPRNKSPHLAATPVYQPTVLQARSLGPAQLRSVLRSHTQGVSALFPDSSSLHVGS